MMPLMLQQILQAGLAFGCVALAVYCAVLARRLRRLNDLESGLGGAIAVMAAEVGRLEVALERTRVEASAAGTDLAAQIEHARKERTLWAIQSRLAVAEPGGRNLRRRRAGSTAEGGSDAQG